MRAEIDLPNTGSKILPGMYAYGEVLIERPGVLALPKQALTYAGGKTFIWRYVDGHAERTEIQTGTAAGRWIEVTNRSLKTDFSYMGTRGKEEWVPIAPSDEVLMGSKLSTLTEGAPVRMAETPAPTEGGESEESSPEETGAG